MENSPRLITKRPTKLSLGRRSLASDSPRTPGRITAAPDNFHTPPSIRPGTSQQSTPLNRFKRTCFAEESPSQDFDSSQLPPMLSQDVRHNIVDVDWKWEEQAFPMAKVINKGKLHKIDYIKTARQPKKAILRESPESVQKKGFYKFKEELMQNINSDTNRSLPLLEEMDELDSSLKENNEVLSPRKVIIVNEPKKIPNEVPQSKPADITEVSTPIPEQNQNDLLDDSDLDNLLLQCSQQVEATYHNQVKRTKFEIETDNHLDSIDELLLAVDEKYIQSPPNSAKQQASSAGCTMSHPPQPRSPLIRHNSMPTTSPARKCPPSRQTIPFTRYNSMPVSDNVPQLSPGFTSGSTESIMSEPDNRRCSAEEIQRKRLEAIQRREANKQKKASSFIKNAVNVRNSLLNVKKNKR